MNERIFELALKSMDFPYVNGVSIDTELNLTNKELEKFAEALIEDCINIYNGNGHQTLYEQDLRVLRHFGVEL